MNKDEYLKRVDNMHSFTGIPSYWMELQDAIREKNVAIAMRAFYEEEANIYKEMYAQLFPVIDELTKAVASINPPNETKSELGRLYLMEKVKDLEEEIKSLKKKLHEMAHKAEQYRISSQENSKLSDYWQNRASQQ